MNTYKQLSSLIEVLELTAEDVFELAIIEDLDISTAKYKVLSNCEGLKVKTVLNKLYEVLDLYFNEESTQERQEHLDEYMGKPATRSTEPELPEPTKRSSYFTIKFVDHRDNQGFAILEDKHKVIQFIEMITKPYSKVSGIFYTNLEKNTFTKVKLIEHEGELMLVGVSK